jgi:hypothetical protein
MALVSSYREGHTCERQARVIKDTTAPIIVDGFVGLCCQSMQKMCNGIK